MLPEFHESRSTGKIIAIVLLSLVCMGGAGYVAYRFMVRNAVPQEVTDAISGAKEEVPVTMPTTSKTPTDGSTSVSTPTPITPPDTDGPTSVVDSDGDGLTNDEERTLGTSVAKPDTDGDGLGDREEVKVYSTDPKKPDTDGDGYVDGDEVKNGYNPNGTGKLLQVPTK